MSSPHVNSPFPTEAVTAPASGPHLLPGGSHPLAPPRLRDLDRRDRCRARKSRRRIRPHAETLVRSLFDTCRVVSRRVVHPRQGGRLERRYRQRLRGRYAVPAFDMDFCWWKDAWLALGVCRVAEGAAVPGVAGVAPRRGELVGVGHGSSVWVEVTL